MYSSVRIAVVGDVHDDWDLQEDNKALQLLQPDLVLFAGMTSPPPSSPHLNCVAGNVLSVLHPGQKKIIYLLWLVRLPYKFHESAFLLKYLSISGDFGNENVELVRSIAQLEMAKAVILGNHDAWSTRQFSLKRKDRVQLQLECLGKEHVGYKRLDFPMLKFSVVGGRPFSCGGEEIHRVQLLSSRYGISSMDESAKRIFHAASGAPEDHLIILLAHNGPTGLGSNIKDICGKDWVHGGGDHGDPDLALAISQLKETARQPIPLVVFGHMHKQLAYGNGLRKMIVVAKDDTIYLNSAVVPRVRKMDRGKESESTKRVFTVIEILNGKVDKIAETWVLVSKEKASLEEKHILFKSGAGISSS